MTNETQPSTTDWDDFSGKFLKAEIIKTWPAIFIPTSLKTSYDETMNAMLIYSGEIEGKLKDWQPNKTNITIMKELGVPSPEALIGKQVVFKKVMNFNPNTKKKVPSVEIELIK